MFAATAKESDRVLVEGAGMKVLSNTSIPTFAAWGDTAI
jgi:hypothetical protein